MASAVRSRAPGEALDWHILCKFTTEHKENRMNIAPSGLAGRLRGDREQQVIAEITEQRWLALTRELVVAGQPSAENPLDPDMPPGREAAVAQVVAAKLADLGLTVELVAKREGRPNVIGTLAGAASAGPTLILNDHLDTYPAGDPSCWDKTGGDPFRPTRDGDFLYARGTSDTRGNLACTILAVEALLRAGVRLQGTLKCVYAVDEEKNGPDGSIFLLEEHGLRADYEITCEPRVGPRRMVHGASISGWPTAAISSSPSRRRASKPIFGGPTPASMPCRKWRRWSQR